MNEVNFSFKATCKVCGKVNEICMIRAVGEGLSPSSEVLAELKKLEKFYICEKHKGAEHGTVVPKEI